MDLEPRFRTYLDELHDTLGDRRRRERFDAYCTGLRLTLERKSVEPIAAAIGRGLVYSVGIKGNTV